MGANGRDVRACVLSDGGQAASTGPGGGRQNGSCTVGGRCERTDTHGLWVAWGFRGAGTSQGTSWPNLETAGGGVNTGGARRRAAGGSRCAPFELVCEVACASCGAVGVARHITRGSGAGGAREMYVPSFLPRILLSYLYFSSAGFRGSIQRRYSCTHQRLRIVIVREART